MPPPTKDIRFPVTGLYTVVEKENISRPEWDELVANAPDGGHLLQSEEWGALKKELGWEPVRLVLERDGALVGLGQFLFYSTPLVPGGMLYCPKGPWLPWDDKEAVRAFFEGVSAAAGRRGAHTVKMEPEVLESQDRVKELLWDIGFERFRWNVNHKTTLLMNLTPSEKELMKNMKKDTRYGVRRAEREGVEVVEDNSPAAIEQFWRMHGAMVDRKDFWSRPRGYYAKLWRVLKEAGRAHLFFAEHEGDRLAAAVVFTFGHKALYMLGVSTREKSKTMPAYLLQWEVMKWAKRNGFVHYDMWGIPTPDKLNKDHPLYGVYKFKAGFGSEIVDFVGTLDLPVKPRRAQLWNRWEPLYFRLHQRLKGDVYY